MSEIKALYLHGLGREDLRKNERLILERNQQKGIAFVPVFIDWRSKETFEELLERVTAQAADLLDTIGDLGRVIIEGSSAGGSLAFNVAKQLDDSRVRAISHSGRLRAGDFSHRSWRNLERCAYLGTDRASQSFYDSVLFCEQVTTPSLTEEDKSRMFITKPVADEVVPVSTMTIEGIRTPTMPIVGHSFGIGLAMLRMPTLIVRLQ